MPTYEFVCNDCDHKFEVFTTISKRDKVQCPKCKGTNISRIFTAVQIKGGGGSTCATCNAASCTSCSIKR
ncbi:hypothetical protein BXT86_02140 [candidate division WOR-3 bacterium 4484_100]|uniref:Putative regulatory protein FmdB zinc ribbon domain-containing protein n=1 Tax=candidate division WOR-3 bacterium 4484_100 TaxID=1936077 RepID=A0A1V4QHD0_UNCW3|nr:MAG: hypothetical protein BXT86_02140 [candidate division WOR-3 bacterium 4484_100]